MKLSIRHLIIFLAISWTTSLSGQSIDEMMQSEDYDKAAAAMGELIAQGQQSAEIYYNLGYAQLKNGQVGSAILALERCLRLSPHDGRAKKLLAIANDEITHPVSVIPDFIGVQVYDRMARILSPTIWVILQIAILSALLYCLYLLLIRGRESGGMFYGLLLLALIVTALGYRSHHLRTADDIAICVTPESTSIYEGADERSPEVTEISDGVKVWIIDEIGDWYKVRLSDRDTGWIQKKKVIII